jgi:hypothetical protein
MKIADHAATPYLVSRSYLLLLGATGGTGTSIRNAMRQKQSRNSFGWMIAGGVVRLPLTVNRPKI